MDPELKLLSDRLDRIEEALRRREILPALPPPLRKLNHQTTAKTSIWTPQPPMGSNVYLTFDCPVDGCGKVHEANTIIPAHMRDQHHPIRTQCGKIVDVMIRREVA